MSKQKRVTKLAFSKGYRVSRCGKFVMSPKCNILKLSIDIKRGRKYYSFSIRPKKGSNPTRCYVHKLQAFQKFGDKFLEANIVTRHLNDISTDNSFDNIEIGSQFENMQDKIRNQSKESDYDDVPF